MARVWKQFPLFACCKPRAGSRQPHWPPARQTIFTLSRRQAPARHLAAPERPFRPAKRAEWHGKTAAFAPQNSPCRKPLAPGRYAGAAEATKKTYKTAARPIHENTEKGCAMAGAAASPAFCFFTFPPLIKVLQELYLDNLERETPLHGLVVVAAVKFLHGPEAHPWWCFRRASGW